MCGGERGDAVWLGLCLPFLTRRTELLAEVENMAAMQSFTLWGSGGMYHQEILVIIGVLRHTEAQYHHRLLSYMYWNWKPSPSAGT